MPTIDAHCHAIADDPVRYPKDPIGGVESAWSARRPVTADRLVAAMDAAGVGKAVVVQASTAYGHDNSYVADSVARHPDRFAGVFSVDLLAGNAVEMLAYWVGRGLSGARIFTTGSTMPGQAAWLSDPRSYPAWEYASGHRLPICVQMRPAGIAPLRALLDRFPDARVVLDHCARPDITDGPPYAAARELFELAAYPGVFLKVTERNLTASTVGPATPETFVGRLIDGFGAGRLLWGSNFPAAEDDLATLLATSRKALAFLPEDQREQIFHHTAAELWGLR